MFMASRSVPSPTSTMPISLRVCLRPMSRMQTPTMMRTENSTSVEKRLPTALLLAPESERSHEVIVVPMFAPSTTQTDCEKPIMPALTKLTAMTEVADED